ncbi:hypothetical protein FB451DRAFT_1437738 [Mycena latifolia]|nr:hypothetical protein FB451DRAFT_1437738 [Mycena latifolia]
MSPSSSPTPRSVLLVVGLLLIPGSAVPTNLTIDDTNTTYFTWAENAVQFPVPNPIWAAATVSHPCDYCSAQPEGVDPTAIYNQTWRDGTVGSTASLTFQGSDVYIYGIDLFNSANISFSMDGETSYHWYPGTSEFVFRALFFEAHGLAPGVSHNVSWVLTKSSTNGTSALFDYAVVTVDTADAGGVSTSSSSSATNSATTQFSTHSKSKVGPIVGGVLGGIALVCVAAISLLCWRRRRYRSAANATGGDHPVGSMRGVQPFITEPSEPSVGSPSKTLNVASNNPSAAPSQPTETSTLPAASEVAASSPGDDRSVLPPPYQ